MYIIHILIGIIDQIIQGTKSNNDLFKKIGLCLSNVLLNTVGMYQINDISSNGSCNMKMPSTHSQIGFKFLVTLQA